MKNKKGFTLVELLAVIVILALIMSIAVISISGVLQGARESTYRETALSIINGVRQRLVLANEQKDGTYYFDDSILESGGKDSPFGGKIKFGNSGGTAVANGQGLYWKTGTATCPTASSSVTDTAVSFVTVSTNTTTKRVTYSICLLAGKDNKFVSGTEDNIMAGAAGVIVN